MTDFKKGLKIGIAAIVALSASYITGLTRRPSYQDLPPKAQAAIIETHDEVKDLLEQSVKDYNNGNLKDLTKHFQQAEKLISTLERIDPKYAELRKTLEIWETLLSQFSRCQEKLDSTIIKIEKLKRPLSKDDIYRLYSGQISTRDTILPALGGQIGSRWYTLSPGMNEAAIKNYIQLLTGWRDLLIRLNGKIDGSLSYYKNDKITMKYARVLIENITEEIFRLDRIIKAKK